MSTTNTFVLQQPFRHRIYSPTTSSPISSLYIKLKNNPYQRQQQMAANSMNIASSVTTTPPLPPPPPSSNVIGEILGDVSIFTASGEPVLFKHLWDQKQGMAVVALLRHFGCPCSWELASALKDSKERFEAAGVKLIAVGVGTPDKAQMLAERLPFPMDSLYCDPDRKAYDVLGLYYGLGRTFFNPASVKVLTRFASLKQAVKNYTIKATPEDRSGVLQQGGMFVFKGNELLYSRKDKGTGDHAPLNEILDLCCTVTVT